MRIKFDGSEESHWEILKHLPRKGQIIAVKVTGNSITIPGAGQAFIGDTIVIEGDNVSIEDR